MLVIRKSILAIALILALAACSAPTTSLPAPPLTREGSTAAATSTSTSPTREGSIGGVAPPQCTGTLAATPAETEGPFYKANTPEKTSLVEPGMGGTKITVTGFVMTRECKPIAHALLDFWQADDKGDYDNAGYRLRGHLFSDAAGRYTLDTILPGLYPGRTRHIHVKVTVPNQPTLTTQLYFPNESRNQSDSIFDRALLVNMQDTPNGKIATFSFVLGVR